MRNKTRNWAIWANEELLAVTVYRKGAQAVLNYIHTITHPSVGAVETKTTWLRLLLFCAPLSPFFFC